MKLGTGEQEGAAAAGVRSPLLEIQSFQLVSGLHSELSEVQLASVVIYFSQITEPDLRCVLYGQNRALFTMRRVT